MFVVTDDQYRRVIVTMSRITDDDEVTDPG
jgi:hypothetical protein